MDSFELTCVFPVSASYLYDAWLDSEKHSMFTGGMAAIEAKIDSYFTAWDGYITGKIITMEPAKRILQHWRTTEFPGDAENSLLDLTFEDKGDNCLLTLRHSKIPEGQGSKYEEGWNSHYFEPMNKYFSSLLN
jgi:activator of HSP90 ATPase